MSGPTRGQARGPGWRSSSRGLFVPAGVEACAEQRIVEAAAVLTREEAVTGWAALRWERARWFDGTVDGSTPRDVPLVTRRERRAQPGFSISQEFLAPADIRSVDGVPVTSRLRSVVFEMRQAPTLGEAVVALDMACYDDLVSLEDVAAYIAQLGPVTGVQQARDALALGEENSWSPRETRMRGVWMQRAGLAMPLCNRPVFTLDGRHVGTPDMIGPDIGLIAQYNGRDHLGLAGMSQDVKKDAAYRDLGLETVTMLATDWTDLDGFTARLLAAARRARAHTGPRAWTLEAPKWWRATHTVSLRRQLDEEQQHRLLSYRRAV